MGIESLLLPAGIALSAALIWTASFKGVFSHSVKSSGTLITSPRLMSEQPVITPVVEPTRIEAQTPPTTEPAHVETKAEPMPLAPMVASAPLLEAPAPFEEPQTAFTNPAISSTAMPTDVSAVTNIASPVENAGPVLVIARPKRTRRAKRLPTDGTPKRRRSTQVKPTLPVESTSITGQQNEVNQ